MSKPKRSNTALVIPTIRTLDFLKEWEGLLDNCHLIVIEDHKDQQIPTPAQGSFASVAHYTWKDIKSEFGKDEWIFSRKNAGIRSYGFWKAYQKKADIIITLDDDCYPVDHDFIQQHADNLSLSTPHRWVNTYPHRGHMFTRGIPYKIRNAYPVMISHGLWTNQIDHDAQTQLALGEINLPSYPSLVQFIPRNIYFPMCSMNLAFRREITPLMYFPLMGEDPDGKPWGYDRFDDIWAGIFAKKICDYLGYGVISGSPFIEHRKASDPHKNLIKEQKGIVTNETLWGHVDAWQPSGSTLPHLYDNLARHIGILDSPYFRSLSRAMNIWSKLFDT